MTVLFHRNRGKCVHKPCVIGLLAVFSSTKERKCVSCKRVSTLYKVRAMISRIVAERRVFGLDKNVVIECRVRVASWQKNENLRF